MRHPVMWFEVLGRDADTLRTFYGTLFGWTFEGDSSYWIVQHPTRGIQGGIGRPYPGTREWVTFYVETPDVTASLGEAARLGGTIVLDDSFVDEPGKTLRDLLSRYGPDAVRLLDS